MFSYIGICDFPSGEQSLNSVQFFQELCELYRLKNRKLMIGVMMSFKTLTGVPSKWTSIWSKKEEVASIFIDHPLVFNTLHFADYDCDTSVVHLVEAVEWGGPNLHAIQLDMIWPPDVIIKGLKRKFPELKIVLQINRFALQHVKNQPELLVSKLRMYSDIVDHVLLDRSHGKGVSMDAEILLPFLRAISEDMPHLRMAVAGGLGPDTLGLAEPVVKEFPNVSLDAQGKLRPSGDATDPIDWSMAHDYMAKSVQLFSR